MLIISVHENRSKLTISKLQEKVQVGESHMDEG